MRHKYRNSNYIKDEKSLNSRRITKYSRKMDYTNNNYCEKYSQDIMFYFSKYTIVNIISVVFHKKL